MDENIRNIIRSGILMKAPSRGSRRAKSFAPWTEEVDVVLAWLRKDVGSKELVAAYGVASNAVVNRVARILRDLVHDGDFVRIEDRRNEKDRQDMSYANWKRREDEIEKLTLRVGEEKRSGGDEDEDARYDG